MKRPPGFPILSLFLTEVVFLRVLALLLGRDPWVHTSPGIVALNLLLVALMAVTAEALWRVRPWCATAATWTAVVALPLFVAELEPNIRANPVGGLALTLLLVLFLVTSVTYVHRRAEALFGTVVRQPPRHRVAVPPPRP